MTANVPRKSLLASEQSFPPRMLTASTAKSKRPPAFLGAWWPHSILRKLIKEIRSFPLRMAASLRLPKQALYRLPKTPQGLPPNSWLESCNVCIQELLEEFPWAGYLDAEILGRAYTEGSRWALDNLSSCTEIYKES
jgi:hypothetical protein